MDASQLLGSLQPDQIAALKAAIDGLTDTSGRSPFKPRQLHDLRLLPTKDDPRPTFFWSADPPRNAVDLTRTTPYPRLMWHNTTGQEISVSDLSAEQTMTAKGFVVTPPANAEAPDALDVIRQQLDALSPEDRAMIVAAAQKDRLARLQEAMAGLSEEELATLATSLEIKRGRGKTAVA